MVLSKEQIDYIHRLLDSKERTAQPLERMFIDKLRKNLKKMENYK
jgi:hypothetical protein